MNSLTYCLFVRCGPQHQAQAHHAIEFASALLQAGHQIERVFFYQQGVLTASELRTPAQGELNITSLWQDLKQQHNLQLDVCIAAALQHGILNQEEAERYEKPAANLAPGFQLAGLGQLASATVTCDRVVSFGGGL